MQKRNNIIGKLGEDSAAKFLEDCGNEIVAKNFRIRSAEIDIVAKDGRTLIFAEVKTLSNINHGLPAEAVNLRKQKKIIEAASVFLQDEKFSDCACRFDVIEVYVNDGKVKQIRQIKNAFEVPSEF